MSEQIASDKAEPKPLPKTGTRHRPPPSSSGNAAGNKSCATASTLKPPPPPTMALAASTRDLKHRVLTCLNKLSDRDTHSSAAAELESIARTLTHDSIPPFLSSISATDASDKSPVRKQCVRLISLLSQSHGDSLSPYLSKLLSAVVRRLRDPDSAVRSACIDATSSISSHITKPPFTSIVKPLIDALVTEQDQNSQIGASLCLAAAIDASPDPDAMYLKKLLPRIEKLLKCDSFKAKPALLTVIGNVIGVGGASSHQTVKRLVPCLVEFIGSEDWSARKAAAEALVSLAVVEREMLMEFKAVCLKTFEAKKMDKVKIVRETMIQLVGAWTEIPDVLDEVSPPPEPQSFSREDSNDGQHPPGSKTSCMVNSGAPQMRKKSIPANGSSFPDDSVATTAQESPLDSSDKKSGPAMFRKLDRKKSTDWKIEITTPQEPSMMVVCEDEDMKGSEKGEKVRSRFAKPETKQTFFNKNADDKKFGGVKAGSGVVPCHDESLQSNVVVGNITEYTHGSQKEFEDLSLIRKQLVHIENQQSSLLNLLQTFMGSSQNGIHSLETRVHGLELALDEISHDLAMSTARLSNVESEGTTCCKLPGAEFFSPKFWRRTEPRHSTSGFSSSRGTEPMIAVRNIANTNGNSETFKMDNRRFRLQGSDQFIVNPLSAIPSDSCGMSEVSSNRVSKNIRDAK
ncbi:TORTIFOLIA1-like protein 4 isoform X3 [Camellia sinensis]|uniref:TORTIFOLIA1-like protein 4 isoform X1 n=1 Tax=Camellia sinensis TaxID=4442 RepID=UPI00103603F2|nr:TORTIFOLIA1-like protein 4 isoform X1 [Camellia sinensis]XP_028052725.1 TORTIFOLIA1-like protein 4 isoform X3 [Camellia sinensis]